MLLTNTNQSITAVLAGAKTSLDANCFAIYEDLEASSNRSLNGGNNVTNTNGVTVVTLVPAPSTLGPTSGSGTNANKRRVNFLSIFNADTGAITLTIRLTNGSTVSVLATFVLQIGDTLQYEANSGWKILSSTGAVKTTQTSGSANQLKVVVPVFPGLLATLVNTNTYRFAVPFNFTVLSSRFVTDVPATTGSKLATITLSTTAGAVTGGVMALTSANQTPTGAAVAATAISGANASGTAGQEVILTVSAVTAFVEGSGHVEIVLQNNS